MLEIEKIKEFIEKHSDKLVFEIYNSGGFANDVTCDIDNTNKENPKLTVYCIEADEKVILFSV